MLRKSLNQYCGSRSRQLWTVLGNGSDRAHTCPGTRSSHLSDLSGGPDEAAVLSELAVGGFFFPEESELGQVIRRGPHTS